MNPSPSAHRLQAILTYIIAAVWLINGLFCKVLNLVPRHRLIVGNIMHLENPAVLTALIGVGEVLMSIWILTRITPRLCALLQIALVATMNTIEFITVPQLLLFGHLNAVLAAVLIAGILYTYFLLAPHPKYR